MEVGGEPTIRDLGDLRVHRYAYDTACFLYERGTSFSEIDSSIPRYSTYHINTLRKLDNYHIRLLKIHKPQESNTATRDLDMFSRFWFIRYSQLNNESRPGCSCITVYR